MSERFSKRSGTKKVEKKTPNMLIELSDSKEELPQDLNNMPISDNTNEGNEALYNEKNLLFSENPISNEMNIYSNLTFSEKKYLTRQNIYLCILNLCGLLFYHIGLMPCEKDPSECTIKKGLMFYVKVGIFDCLSSLLYSIYVSITIYHQKYFFHYLYTLLGYIYYIAKYRGTETIDHGLYNSIGWFVFLVISVIIFLCVFKLYDLIRFKNYKALRFIVIAVIAFIIYYNTLPGFSCELWDVGLNNTRINNDKNIYPCKILLPGKDKCYLKKMEGNLDFSRIFRPSCTTQDILDGEKKILLNSLSDKYFGVSKLNHFGYPITTNDKYSMYLSKDLYEYQELINLNVIKMDLYNKDNYPDESYPEVEVFFDENNHGKIKINRSH